MILIQDVAGMYAATPAITIIQVKDTTLSLMRLPSPRLQPTTLSPLTILNVSAVASTVDSERQGD